MWLVLVPPLFACHTSNIGSDFVTNSFAPQAKLVWASRRSSTLFSRRTSLTRRVALLRTSPSGKQRRFRLFLMVCVLPSLTFFGAFSFAVQPPQYTRRFCWRRFAGEYNSMWRGSFTCHPKFLALSSYNLYLFRVLCPLKSRFEPLTLIADLYSSYCREWRQAQTQHRRHPWLWRSDQQRGMVCSHLSKFRKKCSVLIYPRLAGTQSLNTSKTSTARTCARS